MTIILTLPVGPTFLSQIIEHKKFNREGKMQHDPDYHWGNLKKGRFFLWSFMVHFWWFICCWLKGKKMQIDCQVRGWWHLLQPQFLDLRIKAWRAINFGLRDWSLFYELGESQKWGWASKIFWEVEVIKSSGKSVPALRGGANFRKRANPPPPQSLPYESLLAINSRKEMKATSCFLGILISNGEFSVRMWKKNCQILSQGVLQNGKE